MCNDYYPEYEDDENELCLFQRVRDIEANIDRLDFLIKDIREKICVVKSAEQ